MKTQELGLVLAQQLLAVDDLHYGYWTDDLTLTLANLPRAQQRFNEELMTRLPPAADGVRILDVGCGTGHLMYQLLQQGYRVDGVLPAAGLREKVQQRLVNWTGYQPILHPCVFEEFGEQQHANQYDVVLFSESFQYVKMPIALEKVLTVLKPGGVLLICDFFKTAAHGDGGPGDKSFGGGHSLQMFRELMESSAFIAGEDRDITGHISPNLDLLNDVLLNRLLPASQTLDQFLQERHPFWRWLLRTVFKRQLTKFRFKYLEGNRTRQVFERYKNYRLMTFMKPV